MDYLKEYNISDEQLEIIKNTFKNKAMYIDLFTFSPEKIEKILNLFKEIGVTNFFDIIMIDASLFFDTVSSIEDRINKYGNKEELGKLINEDVNNLMLADLM